MTKWTEGSCAAGSWPTVALHRLIQTAFGARVLRGACLRQCTETICGTHSAFHRLPPTSATHQRAQDGPFLCAGNFQRSPIVVSSAADDPFRNLARWKWFGTFVVSSLRRDGVARPRFGVNLPKCHHQATPTFVATVWERTFRKTLDKEVPFFANPRSKVATFSLVIHRKCDLDDVPGRTWEGGRGRREGEGQRKEIALSYPF